MKKRTLFALWGGLFALCAALGFVPAPVGVLKAGMTLLALLFFVPPFLLIRRSRRTGDRHTLLLIRNLALASLVLTLVLIIANFLAFSVSEFWGSFLNGLLVIVSSPMVCSGYWAVSLFLWACLLFACLQSGKNSKRKTR